MFFGVPAWGEVTFPLYTIDLYGFRRTARQSNAAAHIPSIIQAKPLPNKTAFLSFVSLTTPPSPTPLRGEDG